jgi:hypothetical protein
MGKNLSSAGHRLGQIVGDWWETEVIYPLLKDVALSLNLFLDNRIVSRTCRKDKVQWTDLDGNVVDYDYVLELGGSHTTKGVPVAFLESFWRRGGRHSKDKARDDTNKLLPMRDAYPTARFLAIAACGEFTEPAREYVRLHNIELFFISKERIVKAFETIGAEIDYPDRLTEAKKNDLVTKLETDFNPENQKKVTDSLKKLAGERTFESFKQRIEGALTATPQEIKIFSVAKVGAAIFNSIEKAQEFLISETPVFSDMKEISQFEYEVTFSDGSVFARSLNTLQEVRDLNQQLLCLVEHFRKL